MVFANLQHGPNGADEPLGTAPDRRGHEFDDLSAISTD
jgi:hypothetical protein